MAALCFNSAEACNKVFSNPAKCEKDMAACSTGYAGGFADNVWISKNDPAHISDHGGFAIRGLPNGAGHICFESREVCQLAMLPPAHVGAFPASAAGCVLDVASCSTGEAGPTLHNWISVKNRGSPDTFQPTAAGILCFAKKGDCEKSNNNPCADAATDAGLHQCEEDTMTCSSGEAGPYADVHWTCKKTYPPGGTTNGGGQFCYDSFHHCVGGPNACNDEHPCTEDAATCATGPAGPTPKNWFCPMDSPAHSLPNGGGQLCFADVKACLDAPNACLHEKECVLNTATCANGIAGPSPYNTFCVYDQPNTHAVPADDKNLPTPGSLPNAAGGNCYHTKVDCLNGPNACFLDTECLPDYASCSTGQAGPTDFWFYCAHDTPVGSKADGGGQLCYDTAKSCFNGPNACGADTPCLVDKPSCSTGPAGPSPNNYVCEEDIPIGQETHLHALSSGSGVLCWETVADCVGGPNGCTTAGKDCLMTNVTQTICSSGQAAANNFGNNVVCLKDIPTGGIANAAGKWCYDTLDHCHKGTNACDETHPCTSIPPHICGTAGKGNSFFCADDYPVDVTKGVTTAGGICYPTPLACMNGPNACNSSFLCAHDEAMTAACKGAAATFSWYCALNAPSKTIDLKKSSVGITSPGSHFKLTFALLCTGLLLAWVRV